MRHRSRRYPWTARPKSRMKAIHRAGEGGHLAEPVELEDVEVVDAQCPERRFGGSRQAKSYI